MNVGTLTLFESNYEERILLNYKKKRDKELNLLEEEMASMNEESKERGMGSFLYNQAKKPIKEKASNALKNALGLNVSAPKYASLSLTFKNDSKNILVYKEIYTYNIDENIIFVANSFNSLLPEEEGTISIMIDLDKGISIDKFFSINLRCISISTDEEYIDDLIEGRMSVNEIPNNDLCFFEISYLLTKEKNLEEFKIILDCVSLLQENGYSYKYSFKGSSEYPYYEISGSTKKYPSFGILSNTSQVLLQEETNSTAFTRITPLFKNNIPNDFNKTDIPSLANKNIYGYSSEIAYAYTKALLKRYLEREFSLYRTDVIEKEKLFLKLAKMAVKGAVKGYKLYKNVKQVKEEQKVYVPFNVNFISRDDNIFLIKEYEMVSNPEPNTIKEVSDIRETVLEGEESISFPCFETHKYVEGRTYKFTFCKIGKDEKLFYFDIYIKEDNKNKNTVYLSEANINSYKNMKFERNISDSTGRDYKEAQYLKYRTLEKTEENKSNEYLLLSAITQNYGISGVLNIEIFTAIE